jgi:hypothetical protein
VLGGFDDGIGGQEAAHLAFLGGPLAEHRLRDEVEHSLPVVASHRDDREVPDLARLYERDGLEDLVERCEAARISTKPSEYFTSITLRTKK